MFTIANLADPALTCSGQPVPRIPSALHADTEHSAEDCVMAEFRHGL